IIVNLHRSKRITPLNSFFPYTTLFRSRGLVAQRGVAFADPRAVPGVLAGVLGRRPFRPFGRLRRPRQDPGRLAGRAERDVLGGRSEEHTSELQSRENLVCRLLLEKKKG